MTKEALIKQKGFAGVNSIITPLGIAANSIDLSTITDHKKPNQIRDEIPTLNQYGYMKSELEFFSTSFLESAKNAKKPVMEIGPAYGWLTHQALKVGAKVVSVDICKEHLEAVVIDAPKEYLDNLYIYQGKFPDEVIFQSESFDSIMASRILHFLEGEDFEKGLGKIWNWLIPGGKFIATNCSIFHSCVKGKMSKIFQERIKNNEPWPGMATYNDFDSVHDEYAASFLNCFYKEQLEELLKKHGFRIETINYFDYPTDSWPDEGKGHIGFVATKI
ncbi:MAG: methyltransferase domain-containing protein [Rickettsiaceae bacterium]|nr:methyltransferase domain-containing protein [Rickettsiaceae bacterium]